MRKLSKIDAAYLAGLIDGEGTIFVQRVKVHSKKMCKRGYHYRSGLAIAITEQSIVKWAKRITGVGQISGVRRHKRKHKPGYRWSVWSRAASILLSSILPYLKLKKRHAKNLIKFQSRMTWYGTSGLPDAEWRRREKHRQISLQLNRRGK